MAGIGRHHADDAIVLALASGLTQVHAAERAGVSEKTVRTRLADPVFKQRVAEVRSQMVERTMAALTASGMAAVQTFLQLLQAESESVRLGAATKLIELAAKLRESYDLEARLAALEGQAASVTIWLTPEWRTLQQTLLTALIAHPEARQAVITELAALEASQHTCSWSRRPAWRLTRGRSRSFGQRPRGCFSTVVGSQASPRSRQHWPSTRPSTGPDPWSWSSHRVFGNRRSFSGSASTSTEPEESVLPPTGRGRTGGDLHSELSVAKCLPWSACSQGAPSLIGWPRLPAGT